MKSHITSPYSGTYSNFDANLATKNAQAIVKLWCIAIKNYLSF